MNTEIVVDSKVCPQCGTSFEWPPNLGKDGWLRRKYCSHRCANLARKGQRRSMADVLTSKDRRAHEEVIGRVCKRFCVTREQLMSANRSDNVSMARAVVCWILRERHLSYPAIGKIVGRDHSTAIHGVRRVELEREKSAAVAAALDELKGAA